MPSDSRRNVFDGDTVCYRQLLAEGERCGRRAVPDIGAWTRPDSRASHMHSRPLYLHAGPVVHAQGSCYLELGATKVLAAVYGPRDLDHKQSAGSAVHVAPADPVSGGGGAGGGGGGCGALVCQLQFAPFAGRRSHQHHQQHQQHQQQQQLHQQQQQQHQQHQQHAGTADSQERQLSHILCTALQPSICLHMFPWLCVSVHVLVLDDDGGALSAAIIAASMALADASVPLYDMVAAVTMLCHDGHVLADPTMDELDVFDTDGASDDTAAGGSAGAGAGAAGAGAGAAAGADNCGQITVGVMTQLDQLCCAYGDGVMCLETIDRATSEAVRLCRDIHTLMRSTVLHKFSQQQQQQQQHQAGDKNGADNSSS